jgi:hypothetical protein
MRYPHHSDDISPLVWRGNLGSKFDYVSGLWLRSGIRTFTIPTLATPRFAFQNNFEVNNKKRQNAPQIWREVLRFTTSQFDDDNYPHQNTMTWCLVSELPPLCRDWLVNLSPAFGQKARITSRARPATALLCSLQPLSQITQQIQQQSLQRREVRSWTCNLF